jgi:hypothetical protein
MTEDTPFKIDLAGLKSRGKVGDQRSVAAADAAAVDHGFVPRQGTERRRGRQPSPRTGQVHAKVYPDVSDAIAEEAQRRGVTQGVILEEAWALYVKRLRKSD